MFCLIIFMDCKVNSCTWEAISMKVPVYFYTVQYYSTKSINPFLLCCWCLEPSLCLIKQRSPAFCWHNHFPASSHVRHAEACCSDSFVFFSCTMSVSVLKYNSVFVQTVLKSPQGLIERATQGMDSLTSNGKKHTAGGRGCGQIWDLWSRDSPRDARPLPHSWCHGFQQKDERWHQVVFDPPSPPASPQGQTQRDGLNSHSIPVTLHSSTQPSIHSLWTLMSTLKAHNASQACSVDPPKSIIDIHPLSYTLCIVFQRSAGTSLQCS